MTLCFGYQKAKMVIDSCYDKQGRGKLSRKGGVGNLYLYIFAEAIADNKISRSPPTLMAFPVRLSRAVK